MPHPYTKEIETCQHLISYCHQTKIKCGLEIDADELARQAQKACLIAENQKKIDERIGGGKLSESTTTKEFGEQATGKSGKNRNKKAKKVEYQDVFLLDVTMFQKFGLV